MEADRSVRPSDLLKHALESRHPEQRAAILAWKLLAQFLRLCQHHGECKADKFKAYTLCVFALAVVDQARDFHQPSPDSAVGYYLLAIWDKFQTFDFKSTSVILDADGITKMRDKLPEACPVDIWIRDTRSNSSNNVSNKFLKTCREKLTHIRVDQLRTHSDLRWQTNV